MKTGQGSGPALRVARERTPLRRGAAPERAPQALPRRRAEPCSDALRPVPLAAARTLAGSSPLGLLLGAATAGGLLAWSATRQDWGPEGYWIPYLGLALVLGSWLPALLHRVGQGLAPERAAPIPFFPIISIIYGTYYGLPVVIADDIGVFYDVAPAATLWPEVQLAFWGWIALVLGFYAVGSALPMGGPLRLPLDDERSRVLAVRLIAVGLGVSLLSSSVELPASIAQPVLFLSRLYKVGIGLLFLIDLRGQLPRGWRPWLWGFAIPAYALIQVGAGSVAQLVFVGAFFVFLWWAAGRRLPWMWLAIGGLFLVVLRGNAAEFRERVWFSEEGQSLGAVERTLAFFELLQERFAAEGLGVFSAAGEMVKGRVAHIVTLEHCVDQTPLAVPYWEGHTYKTLPASFIPRVLWPDKPSKQVGQDFGHRYQIIAEADRTTAVNLPQLIELYINFGARGMLLGMLALGVLYRLLYRKLNTAGAGDGTILLAATLFSLIINIESDFSMVWGAVIQRVLLLYLILRWARSRPEPANEPVPAG